MKKLSHFISSLGNSHHNTHDLENSLSSSSFSFSSSEMVNHLVNAMNETSQHSVQEISEQIGFTFPKEEFKLGPVPDDVIFHVFYFVDLTFVVSVAAKVCVQWLRVSQRMVGKRVDLTSDKNWSNSLLQECGRSVTIFLNMMSSSEAFSTITELNLSKSRIGFEGLKLFCHCSFLPKLKILNLHDNNLGNEGIELLMMKPVENLEFLDVSLNHFGKLGLQAITSSPHLKNLKTLHLNHNLLASEGISELCKNSGEWIQHLESLDLSSCGMIWENDYTTLLACEKFKFKRIIIERK
ncbi:hypothetical protein C9374_000343 [Naegleria lovaniensis]|uniref:F-box domain-containing protein n=1 Tax=Naegleria lovaniensis TaxID=51637 RepID=A0AA88GZM6_NAELO|nr:uncharacterized protein C9374_000343 [Naegleria lovaniensis]KAG2388904.1 hypothetical protein C9374_000343 [Naegleria lovaniensis]